MVVERQGCESRSTLIVRRIRPHSSLLRQAPSCKHVQSADSVAASILACRRAGNGKQGCLPLRSFTLLVALKQQVFQQPDQCRQALVIAVAARIELRDGYPLDPR